MKTQNLTEKVEESKCLGYVSSNMFKEKTPGFQGKLAMMESWEINAIRDEYFDIGVNDAKRFDENLKNILDETELTFNTSENYKGHIIGIDKWLEDKNKEIMINLKIGHFHKYMGSAGLPIYGVSEMITQNDYYKGFGFPRIYSLNEGKKAVSIEKKLSDMQWKFSFEMIACESMAMMCSPMFLIGLNHKFDIISNPLLSFPLTLSPAFATLSYMYKAVKKRSSLWEEQRKLTPLYSNSKALDKLKEIYKKK